MTNRLGQIVLKISEIGSHSSLRQVPRLFPPTGLILLQLSLQHWCPLSLCILFCFYVCLLSNRRSLPQRSRPGIQCISCRNGSVFHFRIPTVTAHWQSGGGQQFCCHQCMWVINLFLWTSVFPRLVELGQQQPLWFRWMMQRMRVMILAFISPKIILGKLGGGLRSLNYGVSIQLWLPLTVIPPSSTPYLSNWIVPLMLAVDFQTYYRFYFCIYIGFSLGRTPPFSTSEAHLSEKGLWFSLFVSKIHPTYAGIFASWN